MDCGLTGICGQSGFGLQGLQMTPYILCCAKACVLFAENRDAQINRQTVWTGDHKPALLDICLNKPARQPTNTGPAQCPVQ
jgi:hypothetical protein